MKALRQVRVGQKLGKYRIEKRLAQGGFADVFRAYDSIEGVRVALKIPQPALLNDRLLEDFKKEVRVTARLDHPHILKIKNAGYVDGHFVIVQALGDCSLADRLKRRISLERALEFADQLLDGLAHAHSHRVLHCDVKPENVILFRNSHLRLADFGLAKVVLRTMPASGSGTLGYVAPEQAMGHPSIRSDVFSAGLVLYRMFAGTLPAWPYDWPPAGYEKLRRRVHPDFVELLRRSLEVEPRHRFSDAVYMLDALRSMHTRIRRHASGARQRKTKPAPRSDWRKVRMRQFQRLYRKTLETVHVCKRCGAPVSEAMLACPWCGSGRRQHRAETRLPGRCPRCKRGVKLDWRFCPWCFGASIGPQSERAYSDVRYTSRCSNRACTRHDLMPFMRYCPWCRTKVRRPWPVADKKERCHGCRWGVLSDYWSTCPWCTRALKRARRNHNGSG